MNGYRRQVRRMIPLPASLPVLCSVECVQFSQSAGKPELPVSDLVGVVTLAAYRLPELEERL